jgi:tetratricopeptide (TPR) repeat protein
MLASEAFRQSPQLSAFLRYIVEETLAGRGGDLKGYSIATLALGRPESFDPQADPIVRVQAGRLRQAIAAYQRAHPEEAVGILLDKGDYVPRFVRMLAPAVEAPAAPLPEPAASRRTRLAAGLAALSLVIVLAASLAAWRWLTPTAIERPSMARATPVLVVEAEAPLGAGDGDLPEIVLRVRDAVSRFDDLLVVHAGAIQNASLPASVMPLLLSISAIDSGSDARRFAARLIDMSDQTMLWSQEFGPAPRGPAGEQVRARIIRAIATTVAQPYGVIHAHQRARLRPDDDGPYGCIVAAFDYWRINDERTHRMSRECLERRVQDYATVGGLHAQLAYLHLEEHRQGYNPTPGNPLDRALASAQRAVTLAPASARSHQALMAAHFARGEMESAWRAADRAMTLNPFDTEIEADIGARYVQTGQPEKGLALMDDAMELNAAPPVWAITFRALGHYLLGRNERSAALASAVKGTEYAPAMMALLMVARQNRDAAAAKEALADLRRLHPRILDDPEAYLKRLAFSDAVIAQISRDFRTSRDWAAGLP